MDDLEKARQKSYMQGMRDMLTKCIAISRERYDRNGQRLSASSIEKRMRALATDPQFDLTNKPVCDGCGNDMPPNGTCGWCG